MRTLKYSALLCLVTIPLLHGCKKEKLEKISTAVVIPNKDLPGQPLTPVTTVQHGQELEWKSGDSSVTQFYIYFQQDGFCVDDQGRTNGFPGTDKVPASCKVADRAQPSSYYILPKPTPPPVNDFTHPCNPGCPTPINPGGPK